MKLETAAQHNAQLTGEISFMPKTPTPQTSGYANGQASLAEPEWECCMDWKPQTDKLNAPLLLAQARNPYLTTTEGFKFKPWNFCPWCGASRGVPVSKCKKHERSR